jgi:hypothetical protein
MKATSDMLKLGTATFTVVANPGDDNTSENSNKQERTFFVISFPLKFIEQEA